MHELSDDEITRYSRHILLDEVGGMGQAKLAAARVLIVGAGGLGSPLVLYLAAAGVGQLSIVDDDAVELSNLQRQVAHTTARLGMAKVESAALAARAINPGVAVATHAARLTPANVQGLVEAHDIVCDGTDNFATRFLLADACHLFARPLVSAAVLRFEAQVSVFRSHLGGLHPCYRCLYSAPPPPGLVPSCAEAGVLGAVTGVAGTLQATEVLKLALGIGDPLDGRLLLWDALDAGVRTVRLRRDPECALCGPHATIADLSAHAETAATCAIA
jgi:adenylyltransferase/sulfurtransferase